MFWIYRCEGWRKEEGREANLGGFYLRTRTEKQAGARETKNTRRGDTNFESTSSYGARGHAEIRARMSCWRGGRKIFMAMAGGRLWRKRIRSCRMGVVGRQLRGIYSLAP